MRDETKHPEVSRMARERAYVTREAPYTGKGQVDKIIREGQLGRLPKRHASATDHADVTH